MKRLVAGVLTHVRDQVAALGERLATHDALVRFLTGVDVGVLLHIRLLVKPLATILTGIRSRVRVDQQVSAERA